MHNLAVHFIHLSASAQRCALPKCLSAALAPASVIVFVSVSALSLFLCIWVCGCMGERWRSIYQRLPLQ